MATCNFREQNGFPLFCTRIFDGEYYEDEETGESYYTDFDEWHFDYCQKKLDDLNRTLEYYEITLESGYYEGVQVYLNEKTKCYGDVPLTKYYTAKDWAEYRKDEKDSYGYYIDFDLPYAERKKAEQKEIKRIIEFCETVLKNDFDFSEYVCTARFSNGEAIYEQANNVRARIKALAVA